MPKENWKDIHICFSLNEDLQHKWEEKGIAYQEAKEWIQAGFKPWEYDRIDIWKHYNFTSKQTKEWIDNGLNKYLDAQFAFYLKKKGHQPSKKLDLWLLRESDLSAKEYLDVIYPKNQRKETIRLNISHRNITGALDLTDFENLEELDCSSGKLTSLNLDKCLKLKYLNCCSNQLTEFNWIKSKSFEQSY